jgi:hypothetical protein
MQKYFALFCLLCSLAVAADTKTPAPAQPKENYDDFLAECRNMTNVVNCIQLMDRLVDEGEHGLVDDQPDPGMIDGTTKFGLHIEFSTTDVKEAIIYYLKISRDGKELRYDDATKFVALFTDRAGLPHPVEVTEGDHSIFYSQWLIKPSSWKSMHKKMAEVRQRNRAEKDPAKALILAVEREVEARSRSQWKN